MRTVNQISAGKRMTSSRYPSTGMKSGMRSIGLSAYATTKRPRAFACHGVRGWFRANQSVIASRLMRLAQMRLACTTPNGSSDRGCCFEQRQVALYAFVTSPPIADVGERLEMADHRRRAAVNERRQGVSQQPSDNEGQLCARDLPLLAHRRPVEAGRVEMWRGDGRSEHRCFRPFRWRCPMSQTMAPFPHPTHRTGHADFPHPALGQDFTPSPTTRRASGWSDARARCARIGAGVDSSHRGVA